jgi:redox-sensitive bicupin YhaK (pirin superfamily)
VGVTVIAGRFDDGQLQQDGAVQRPHTTPQLFDLHLPAGSRLSPRLADGQRVMLYVYEGELAVNGHTIGQSRLARLSEAGAIEMGSVGGARVLLIAGTPLNEPIVQYGPFVMNSREEIEQALRDFRDDRLTA